MQKIPIIVTNGKKSEIVKELESSDFDLNQIEISESIRGREFVYRIKFIWLSFKSSIQHFLRRTKEFIKYRRLEPMLAGGSFGLESFYGFIFNLFATIIMPGVAFDIIKVVIKKSYKHFKTKKVDYLMIVSAPRMPFDCKVKILIPNNLNDDDLDQVLYQANEIFTNLDNVRNYFGNREIIAKCFGNYKWKIRFK